MTKTDKMLTVAKELIRAAAKVAEYEGADRMTRVDFTSANYGWRSRYNPNHTKNTFGFHISPLMEEVANEEGWVFAYDVRANGSRDNIRIEFPLNDTNRELKAA
jgi:hypothetical protein